MKNCTKGLTHLLMSCRYSIAGLKCAWHEAALRQEILLGILNVIAIVFVPTDVWVKILLIVLWFLILMVELLNTAIEKVVDLASPNIHPLAKEAKDIASAAVFVSLTVFFATWAIVVWFVCR